MWQIMAFRVVLESWATTDFSDRAPSRGGCTWSPCCGSAGSGRCCCSRCTLGSTAEVERAGARVRRLHAALRGHDPDTGYTFRVDHPDHLLWVHATEVD